MFLGHAENRHEDHFSQEAWAPQTFVLMAGPGLGRWAQCRGLEEGDGSHPCRPSGQPSVGPGLQLSGVRTEDCCPLAGGSGGQRPQHSKAAPSGARRLGEPWGHVVGGWASLKPHLSLCSRFISRACCFLIPRRWR